MTPERWHRIEVLFEQALERPEPERTGFLTQACAGEPDLHGDLVELLASALEAGTSLRNAVVAEAQVLASDAVTVQVGRRIGPFRLLALLGQGGMGAVYRDRVAQHASDPRGARAQAVRGEARAGEAPVEFDETRIATDRPWELVALDEALDELAKFDARKARVIELHYFGGLTQDEISAVCEIHVNTVARDLRLGKRGSVASCRTTTPTG